MGHQKYCNKKLIIRYGIATCDILSDTRMIMIVSILNPRGFPLEVDQEKKEIRTHWLKKTYNYSFKWIIQMLDLMYLFGAKMSQTIIFFNLCFFH